MQRQRLFPQLFPQLFHTQQQWQRIPDCHMKSEVPVEGLQGFEQQILCYADILELPGVIPVDILVK